MNEHLKEKDSYMVPTFITENQSITKGWTIPVDCFERSGSGSPSYLTMSGRIFFLENVRYINTMWYSWIYLLGTKEEAECYIYEIKVTNQKQGEELTYRGEVVSCDVDVTNVLSNVSVLTFTDATARRFLQGKVLKCNVKINKKVVQK
jgi:Seven in absentia protein family